MVAKAVAEKQETKIISERVRKEHEELLSATSHVDSDKLKSELEVYQEAEG